MQSRPSPQQQHSTDELSSLRTALQQARAENDNDSQPDEEASADEAENSSKPAKRPKRARACIACRNMKIRCLPVEGKEACLGCSKVNRECIMPGPARKRQKTVHKVAELEKKINALTDALINQQHAHPTPPKSDSPTTVRDPPTNTTATSDSQRDLERLQQYDRELVEKRDITFDKGQLDWGCSKWNKFAAAKEEEPYIDIIDRDLLDIGTATRIFDYYTTDMLPHFPLLAFPSTIFAQDVRTARPMLFLAILTVASPSVKPELHENLVIEMTRQLSERIMFLGEKSLEIVQAILVYTSCYSRSKYAKDLTFNQLIHSAVVMCLDLGMGKRYKKLDRDVIEEAEIRRTWMAVYYFASNVSILLRHPSLVRWSPYLEECHDFFIRSPDTVDKDRWLCAMVQTQRMAEEISVVFDMHDPSSTVSFGDTSTQYHVKAFEKQLASWPDTVPASINKNIAQHMASSLNLYLHEIAIHHDHNVDDFRPDPDTADKHAASTSKSGPARFDSGSFVTTRHIAALSQCLDACHQVLDNYLALPIQVARSISNLGIVWNTYAAVALIKLHGVLHAPDSKFGHIFTPDLKVQWYLDTLIHRLQEISADGRCPPAEAFIYVVHKLRHWFQHKRAPMMEESEVFAVVKEGEPGSEMPSRRNDIHPADKAHVDHVMKIARDEYGLPDTLPGSGVGTGNQSGRNSISVSDSQAMTQQQQQQIPTTIPHTQQDTQPLIGTSSMPASQFFPGGNVGGFPQSSWNAVFPSNSQSQSQQFNNGAPPMQMTSDLNVAYDNAQNYSSVNWDDLGSLQFGRGEMEMFDDVMGGRDWMGYLI